MAEKAHTPGPVTLAEDRSITVPPGAIVKTAYVDVHRVKLANRTPMASGDIDRAINRQLQLGAAQAWPCPVGEWDGEWFEIRDGRHAYLAALARGMTHLLVAWVE